MNVSASARLQCCVSVDVVSENFLLRCGRKWSSTHSLTMMFAFALSLIHSVCDCTHHTRCMLTLTISLTCDCTHHCSCPLPVTHFTCACTRPPPCFPSPPHSPTHSVVLTLTNMFARTLSPNHSVCNCTYGRPRPLTHSLLCSRLHTPWSCLPSPSHSLTLLMIALTIVYACPLTHTLYLWLHSLSYLCPPLRMRNGVIGRGCCCEGIFQYVFCLWYNRSW